MCARMMGKKCIFITALYRNNKASLRFAANAAEDWIEEKSEMRGLFVQLRTNGWTKINHFFVQ